MPISYAGIPGIHEVESGVRYTPGTGRVLVRRFTGHPDDIRGLQGILERLGTPYTIPAQAGGFHTIDVEEPQSRSPVAELDITWDLVGNDLEKDIYQHESLLTAGASASAIGTLRRVTAEYDSGETTYAASVNQLTAEEVADGIAAGTLSDLFLLHAAQVQSFSDSAWVVRRTARLGPRFPAQTTILNVRAVYETSGDFASFELIPATRKWVLPAGQWLKRTPNYQQQTNGNTTYTQEWWWAKEWSVTLYERATL